MKGREGAGLESSSGWPIQSAVGTAVGAGRAEEAIVINTLEVRSLVGVRLRPAAAPPATQHSHALFPLRL